MITLRAPRRSILEVFKRFGAGLLVLGFVDVVATEIPAPAQGLYVAGKAFFCYWDRDDYFIACDGGTIVEDEWISGPSPGVQDYDYRGSSFGAAVYDQAIYAFYTTEAGRLKYGKMNPSGSLADSHTIATGLRDHGASAAVLRDTIYVFTPSGTFTSANGTEFAVTGLGPPPQAQTMVDAVTFFPSGEGSPGILLVYLDSDSNVRSSVFDGSAFSTPQTLTYQGDWPGFRQGGLLLGTRPGGAKAPSVQFYGLSQEVTQFLPQVRYWGIWEYDLASRTWSGPADVEKLYADRSVGFQWAPWFETVDKTKGTLRLQHLISKYGVAELEINESDLLIPQNNDTKYGWGWAGLPTATASATGDDDKAKKLRNLWSLVGVVLGPPPFATNGATDASGLAEVDYGISTQQSISTTQTTTQTISVGSETSINGGLGEAHLDLSYAHGWLSSHGETDSVEVATDYTFGPVDEPLDKQGTSGWAIFHAPILLTQHFKIYAYDGTTYLGQDMFTTSAPGATTQIAYFDLQTPSDGWLAGLFAGMPTYPHSTDLADWLNIKDWDGGGTHWRVTFGPYSQPAVDQLQQGTATTVTYTTSQTKTDTKGNTNSFSVEAGVQFDLLAGFSEGITVGYDAEFETTTELETTITNSVSASLNMPFADQPGDINKLTIQPYWLQATTKDAPWIPSDYSGNLPWAITWDVKSYETVGGGTSGVSPSVGTATGVIWHGDEAATSALLTARPQSALALDSESIPWDSYTLMDAPLAWIDQDGLTIPLTITADEFDPGKGVAVSGNGQVFTADPRSGQWSRDGDQWRFVSSEGLTDQRAELVLDFGGDCGAVPSGCWSLSYQTSGAGLEQVFPLGHGKARVVLDLNGLHRFVYWLDHEVFELWSQSIPEAASEAYAVDFVSGRYDSSTGAGYLQLRGHVPEGIGSFGDVELIINEVSVSIPLLQQEGFLDTLAGSGVLTHQSEGVSFTMDLGSDEWNAQIDGSAFDAQMAPRHNSVHVQFAVGGRPICDQTIEISDYASMVQYQG